MTPESTSFDPHRVATARSGSPLREHGHHATLPTPVGSLIGREHELATLTDLLNRDAVRLVSLIGPGGVGKTRLAIAAGARLGPAFADGATFVPLQDVPDVSGLADAIAAADGIHLGGHEASFDQLLAVLKGRRQLLILDNFEHLVDGAALVREMLEAAPEVRVLVTSREALQLLEEWRVPLAGLTLPDTGSTPGPDLIPAAHLFVERARRVRLDFDYETEWASIVRVCRLVEGLPLAIELAAAWAATLPISAIADEIEHDLSLLSSSLRNAPERHRSLRAVFDQSWRLLSSDEQALLQGLAQFRGGFRREAAIAVADATLPHLATLVAKSLIRYEADGRFHLHALVRQFVLAQPWQEPGRLAQIQAIHARYYLTLLAEQGNQLAGGDQAAVLDGLAVELDNIRLAWHHALDRGDIGAITPAVWSLANFFHCRGRYQEGIAELERTIQRLRELDETPDVIRALPAALHELGQLYTRLGRFAESRAVIEEARTRYEELGDPMPQGLATDPEIGLGVLALAEGDYPAATHFGERVCRRSAADECPGNLPYGWYIIAQAAMAEGRYGSAREAAWNARADAQRSGDTWFLAYCLNTLGAIAVALGERTEAREHYLTSLKLRETIRDPEGTAVALVHLGEIANLDQDFAEATELFERALKLYRDIGDRGGLAAALHGLGLAAAGMGDQPAAAHYLEEALGIASEISFAPQVLRIALSVIEAGLIPNVEARVATVLAAVAGHRAVPVDTAERARRLLAAKEATLPTKQLVSGAVASTDDDLGLHVAWLRAELAEVAAGAAEDAHPLLRTERVPQRTSPTISLTEREAEVLHRLANGASNQQIASEMFLAVSTVKWYVRQILGKLEARNRTEAVARARALGLIS